MLDASGSMFGDDGTKWTLGLEVANSLVESLTDDGRIALLAFGGGGRWELGFGSSRDEILQLILRLRSDEAMRKKLKGRTALYDHLLRARSMLEPPQTGDLVYVISDGEENVRPGWRERVRHTFGTSGVRLFATVLMPPQGASHRDELVAESYDLILLSEAVGGSGIPLESGYISYHSLKQASAWTRDSKKRLDRLFRQMTEVYEMELELPMPVSESRSWKLEAHAPGTKEKKSWCSTLENWRRASLLGADWRPSDG